jgi:hypothetical protein
MDGVQLMIREKSGRLINDRTELIGFNIADLILLIGSFSFVYFGLLDGDGELPLFIIYTVFGIILHVIRTTKRNGWLSEKAEFYYYRIFHLGVKNVKRIHRSKKSYFR